MSQSYSPTCISWMPSKSTVSKKKKGTLDMGFLASLKERDVNNNHASFFKMLEASLPPILARKFHIVKIYEHPDKVEVGVGCWFLLWSKTLPLHMLNLVHRKHAQFLEANTGHKKYKKLATWRENMDKVFKLLVGNYQLGVAPLAKHLCTRAIEFILEPTVLIQLPWQPALLHQWLVASLTEVLMFEKVSLEFRHWPLPLEARPVTIELLSLVRKLKERIILGLVILFQQAIHYPKVRDMDPGMILDDVVTPSIATLQFLITGKAHKVVKNLKKICFTRDSVMFENLLPLPASAYLLDAELEKFYSSQFYNMNMWNTSDVPHPFPAEDIDIAQVAKRIRESGVADVDPLASPQIKWHKLRLDEQIFFKYIEAIKTSLVDPLENPNANRLRVTSTTGRINECVLEPNRLANSVTVNMVLAVFNTEKALKQVDDLFTERHHDTSAVFQAHIAGLMHECLGVTLLDAEKENSALARVMMMEVDNLEREQVVRLTNLCCVIFDTRPIAINHENVDIEVTEEAIDKMDKLVRSVEALSNKYDRDALWALLPDTWRETVKFDEAEPLPGTSQFALIKKFESRLGKIVYNCAKESHQIYKRGGAPFSEWPTVQYLLPAMASILLTTTEDGQCIPKFVDLLHELVGSYEKKYKLWLLQCEPRKTVKMRLKSPYREAEKLITHELRALTESYVERIRLVLRDTYSFYSGTSPSALTPLHAGMLDKINTAMLGWPDVMLTNQGSVQLEQYFDLHHAVKAWIERSANITKHWVCMLGDGWKVPTLDPEMDTKYPRLAQLVFASEVIVDCFSLCRLILPYIMPTPANKKAIINLQLMGMKKDNWVVDLKCHPSKMSEKEIQEYVKTRTKHLADAYDTIKYYRSIWTADMRVQTQAELQHRTPAIKDAVEVYYRGELSKLDALLTIFHAPPKIPPKVCRNQNCTRKGRKQREFVVCELCVTDKYPDVNWFCHVECRTAWWEVEHHAEHLEFELGLADFSHLNLGDGK